jgi:hypothetical protein
VINHLANNSKRENHMKSFKPAPLLMLLPPIMFITACSAPEGSQGGQGFASATDALSVTDSALLAGADTAAAIDITNKIFDSRAGSCSDYINTYDADITDVQRGLAFDADLIIIDDGNDCKIVSNNIPNHDFNDTGSFATDAEYVEQSYRVDKTPSIASNATALTNGIVTGIMLNGVLLDILSAGCYDPSSAQADSDGNTPIGCNSERDDWMLDPLATAGGFGTDSHNAHVQPGGLYHYHGSPNAMFDADNPSSEGSPVIGFAADGYPIYGNYFKDELGAVRKAISGFTLKSGTRPSGPGGNYDGTYVADWEFTGQTGTDLDACNGMTVDGQYGYYVTDAYPWIIGCHSGTPHDSFKR